MRSTDYFPFWLAVILLAVLAGPRTGFAQEAHPGATSFPRETLHAKEDPRIPLYRPLARLSGERQAVGADTMEDLMSSWVRDFTKIYPQVRIPMVMKGSLSGEPALAAGKSQMAPVARELLLSEEADFHAKFGYAPFGIAVAGGSYRTPGKSHAIAFFVNKDNPVGRLTFAQLDAIFSTTRKRGFPRELTRWGQLGLRGKWANAPIDLYGLKTANGIAHFIQMRVLDNGQYRTGIHTFTTVGSLPALQAITQAIAADPFGIGYSGFEYANPHVKTLALAVDPAGPYYAGTFRQVASQTYPLSRFIYVFVNRPPGKPLDPVIREFLSFVLSRQGQEVVVREGIFLPLPYEILQRERAKLGGAR